MYKSTVSICTPTYNRRNFIPNLIECIKNQDYSKDLLEWIIIDDGEDKIKDIILSVIEKSNFIKIVYVELPQKVSLGKKRNIMHEHASGDILVYMDDDDYYPPSRVSHAVKLLEENPDVLCAGCSKVYVYFTDRDEIYSFGPYGSYHATANTFAFKRELLKETKYKDDATISEEKHFLKNYTIPMIQLNTLNTILIISHNYNTYDKRQILKYAKKSKKSINYFIDSGFLPNTYKNNNY